RVLHPFPTRRSSDLVWPSQIRLSLPDFLEKAKSLGFAAVMLMAKRPHLSVLDCDTEARKQLRAKLQRLDLKIACLAGYTDFCMRSEEHTSELQSRFD